LKLIQGTPHEVSREILSMALRRTVLSLVLVGASAWCTGLVKQAHSEQQQLADPPAQAEPVAAPDGVESTHSDSQRLAETGRDDLAEISPAG
jgi:hypothetical protein